MAIGEMPGICIVPPQLGSVPTLAFMAEVPIQMEAADDDSASEASSDAGQMNWAEQLEAVACNSCWLQGSAWQWTLETGVFSWRWWCRIERLYC